MRKLITSAMVSLDNVMQAPSGPEEDPSGEFNLGGWTVPYMDDFFGDAITSLFDAPFDLLLGRKTYELFAAYWPYQSVDNLIARRFNAATKYVATRAGTPLTWKDSFALLDAAADVARLKQGDGPDLLTQGSSDLIQTLLAHDLIDEFRVFTFPILLGHGKRLFGEGARPVALRIEQSMDTTTGVTIKTYRRAGAVRRGDLEAEIARRGRMRREG